MKLDLTEFTRGGLKASAIREITACNQDLQAYGSGLSLTVQDAEMLYDSRTHALRNYGRIEFGGGITAKLVRAFATSPNVTKADFAATLCDLTEIFYAYKNETDYKISDDELISAMRQAFDGSCHGSVELLSTRGARMLLRLALTGEDTEHPDDSPLEPTAEGGDEA